MACKAVMLLFSANQAIYLTGIYFAQETLQDQCQAKTPFCLDNLLSAGGLPRQGTQLFTVVILTAHHSNAYGIGLLSCCWNGKSIQTYKNKCF